MGREQTTGVRVHAGSQPRVSLLLHQSSVCFSLPNFQRQCDCEECATACNSLSTQCSTFTAVACGTLGRVKLKFLSGTNHKCLIKRITHITTFDGILRQKLFALLACFGILDVWCVDSYLCHSLPLGGIVLAGVDAIIPAALQHIEDGFHRNVEFGGPADLQLT